jgi:hypothetical protein
VKLSTSPWCMGGVLGHIIGEIGLIYGNLFMFVVFALQEQGR